MSKKKEDKPTGALQKFDKMIGELADTAIGKLLLGHPEKGLTQAAVPSPRSVPGSAGDVANKAQTVGRTTQKALKALEKSDKLERQAFQQQQSVLQKAMDDLDKLAQQVAKSKGRK